MSEKDLEKNLDEAEVKEAEAAEETTEADTADVAEGTAEETAEPEGKDWEFDSAPTVEGDLELDEDYEVDMSEAEPVKKTEKKKKDDSVTVNVTINKKLIKILCGAIVGVVALVLIIVFGIRYYTVANNTETMNPGNIALTVDETEVSVGMFDYVYASVVYQYEYYAEYGYYDLDTTTDYSEQYTEDDDGNEITWLDRFELDTISTLRSMIYYYELAVDYGLELTEDEQTEIDEEMATLDEYAAESDMTTEDYIAENYGEYCGEATLRKYLEWYYLANQYYYISDMVNDVSDEEVQAYFEENENEYTTCEIGYIQVTYDTTDDDTATESEAQIREYAESIETVDDMIDLIPEAMADAIEYYVSYGYYDDEDAAAEGIAESVETEVTKATMEENYGSDFADWLFDEDTEIGDVDYCCMDDDGYAIIVIKLSENSLDETEVYSVRHILITPGEDDEDTDDEDTDDEDDDDDDEYTEEELAAALEEAEEILAEYEAGEQTELAFAQLAETYSDDTESTSSGSSGLYGGLYEETALGEMVEEFEDWATDESREYGDVEIIQTDYGYHIMFFIYDGPTYFSSAKADLLDENANTAYAEIEAVEGRGFDLHAVATPSSSS